MSSKHQNDIGTFMVAVGAVIENPETGEILLLQRSQDNYKPNTWEIGYGRMDQGEDPEAALKREFYEETGLKDLKIISILSTWHFYRGEEIPENEVVGITFWAQSSTQKIKISHEHQDSRWVDPQEALKLIEVDRIKQDVVDFLEAKKAKQAIGLAKDKEQRAIADYQNLIRRTREERAKVSRFAAQSLIEDLIEPLEHLTLASNQLNDAGLAMVKNQLWQSLSQHGLEEINPIGQKFDLETMEAVEKQSAGEIVISVTRSGFKLNDEVIRHAKVILGKPSN